MTEEPTIITKNSNGVVTYKKYSTGDEYWYDDNGVLRAYKEPDGYEAHSDSHGLVIYMKFPSGNEVWFDNHKVCRRRFKNGVDEFYESNGNITCKKNSKSEAHLIAQFWLAFSVICFMVSIVCFAKAANSIYFSEPTPSPNSVEVRK
jgi:hypothetical protein